jgi:hypothetical protein
VASTETGRRARPAASIIYYLHIDTNTVSFICHHTHFFCSLRGLRSLRQGHLHGRTGSAWHGIRLVRSLSHSRVTEELWLGQKASFFSVRVRLVAARLRLSGGRETKLTMDNRGAGG